MKAYIAIKYYKDFRNRREVDKITEILEDKGYETICIIRDEEKDRGIKLHPKDLMELTFRRIDACELVIIDLSEKGVGLGIEAGYAHAKGKLIITIAKKGSDISDTLRGISEKVVIYDDIDSLAIICSNNNK